MSETVRFWLKLLRVGNEQTLSVQSTPSSRPRPTPEAGPTLAVLALCVLPLATLHATPVVQFRASCSPRTLCLALAFSPYRLCHSGDLSLQMGRKVHQYKTCSKSRKFKGRNVIFVRLVAETVLRASHKLMTKLGLR